MNTQTIIIEFKNCAPYAYKVKSEKPITIETVVEYFQQTEGFDPERDSIIFIGKIEEINIDGGNLTFEKGREAYFDGCKKSDNPFCEETQTEFYDEWVNGWLSGDKDCDCD